MSVSRVSRPLFMNASPASIETMIGDDVTDHA